jgi:hypothetical protein
VTLGFGNQYSIHLSYGRIKENLRGAFYLRMLPGDLIQTHRRIPLRRIPYSDLLLAAGGCACRPMMKSAINLSQIVIPATALQVL